MSKTLNVQCFKCWKVLYEGNTVFNEKNNSYLCYECEGKRINLQNIEVKTELKQVEKSVGGKTNQTSFGLKLFLMFLISIGFIFLALVSIAFFVTDENNPTELNENDLVKTETGKEVCQKLGFNLISEGFNFWRNEYIYSCENSQGDAMEVIKYKEA